MEINHDAIIENNDDANAFKADKLTGYEKEQFEKLLNGELVDDITNQRITIYDDEINALPSKVEDKQPGCRSIFVDFDQVCTWIPTLRMKLKMNPVHVIDTFSDMLERIVKRRFTDDFSDHGYFHVRPVLKIPEDKSGFDDISSKMIGKLVNLKGIITTINHVQPYPVTIVFNCTKCGYEYKLEVKTHSVYYPPPKMCPNPECASGARTSWNISTFESRCIDFQRVTLQEEPNFLKSREQPRNIRVAFTDDIVKIVKPGSRVIVNGLLVATPLFNETKKVWDYSLFDLHVYAFNIQSQDSEELEFQKISEERKTEIMEYVANHANDRDKYFTELVKAVAPMIYGHDLVKIALLCVSVGGQTYIPNKGGRIRGTINVLLIGDPGCAKSKMIESLKLIVPRFEYGSGQASTKAGMTAAVVKEGKNDVELVAGLVVRSDGGISAIDEFEKINKDDRSALHEQMEAGKISINKYKFHETLNARTSIVAAANPKDGELKPPDEETIQKQIEDIPIPIQTRFDLIFLIEDIPNLEIDRKMLEKMMEMRDVRYAKPLNTIDIDTESEMQKHVLFVRDLIIIAKKHADDNPIGITHEAKSKMMDYYLEKRQKTIDAETGRKKRNLPTPITPRQFESLHRIATAFAKLTFSKEVDVDHVTRAMTLVDESMKQYLMDEDGNVDAGMGATGVSKAEINKDEIFLIILHDMELKEKDKDENTRGILIVDFKNMIKEQTNMKDNILNKVFDRTIKREWITYVDGKRVKLTSDGKAKIGVID